MQGTYICTFKGKYDSRFGPAPGESYMVFIFANVLTKTTPSQSVHVYNSRIDRRYDSWYEFFEDWDIVA